MYIRQLKVERKLSLAASQLTLKDQVKAKPKGKAKAKSKTKKSQKIPKTKVAPAWNQSQAGSRSTYTHGKLRVATGKEGVKAQGPR
ncbi:hypothetical protein M959_02690, partial [Chaetura pelagica]